MMRDTHHHEPTNNNHTGGVAVDLSPFLHHVEGLDLDREQALDVLSVLYDLMKAFVDLGFDLHPLTPNEESSKLSSPPGNSFANLIRIPTEYSEHEEAPPE